MEINNITNNSISDLSLQNSFTKPENSINTNSIDHDSSNLSNSYFINTDITAKRSELSNNLSPLISEIATNQIELSKLSTQDNILNNIITTSAEVRENPETLIPQVEQSLNELMSKYKNTISNDIASENENSKSTAYFDGLAGATPLKIQDIIDTAQKIQTTVKEDIKIIENNIDTIKTDALNNIQNEISNNTNLKPNKQIDFGKHTSDFSASNINSLLGSVIQTQANAIPIQSQRLLS